MFAEAFREKKEKSMLAGALAVIYSFKKLERSTRTLVPTKNQMKVEVNTIVQMEVTLNKKLWSQIPTKIIFEVLRRMSPP